MSIPVIFLNVDQNAELDCLKSGVIDAVVCDVNKFHSTNKQYGRQFGDRVLRSIGNSIKKLAKETGGIGCRQDGDTFPLYCQHQDDYERMFKGLLADVFAEEEIADKVSLRFGVFADVRQESDIEERQDCNYTANRRIPYRKNASGAGDARKYHYP